VGPALAGEPAAAEARAAEGLAGAC